MITNLSNIFGLNALTSSSSSTSALSKSASDTSVFDETSTSRQEGLPQNQDPDAYAQEYADEKGISLEEAKAELEAKFGKPQEPDQNFQAQA